MCFKTIFFFFFRFWFRKWSSYKIDKYNGNQLYLVPMTIKWSIKSLKCRFSAIWIFYSVCKDDHNQIIHFICKRIHIRRVQGWITNNAIRCSFWRKIHIHLMFNVNQKLLGDTMIIYIWETFWRYDFLYMGSYWIFYTAPFMCLI